MPKPTSETRSPLATDSTMTSSADPSTAAAVFFETPAFSLIASTSWPFDTEAMATPARERLRSAARVASAGATVGAAESGAARELCAAAPCARGRGGRQQRRDASAEQHREGEENTLRARFGRTRGETAAVELRRAAIARGRKSGWRAWRLEVTHPYRWSARSEWWTRDPISRSSRKTAIGTHRRESCDAMADCAERQRDEFAALAAIYGDEFELHDVAPGEMASCALRSTETRNALHAAATIISRCPPEIDCTDTSLLERLRSIILSDGNECLMQICGEFHDALADNAAAQAEAAVAGSTPSDDREECILKIDHMNDADGYRKILRNWARALALSGRVLYANSGKRVHGVFVVLHGAPSSIGGFLQRLRTETVDVDRSGRPCKERQSTVLARRPLADRPPLEGYEEEEYDDSDDALDAALERLGVLHCGVGAQRFGVR